MKQTALTSYPLFSVIIPTYNRADFIEQTLQTVLHQTYRLCEIIVVDDCSTDRTEELLQPYVNAGQIAVIKNERNSERAVSRNRGMSVAQGDFVTFLDSDDFMYPNNLADAAEYARAHPELKCFQNRLEYVNADREVVYRPPYPSLNNRIKSIANSNFMSCIGNFMHREIYQQYRFDPHPDLVAQEDWDFWLRVLADHPVGRIEKVNNGVLQHSGRSVNTQSLESLQAGLDYINRKLREDPHLAAVYRPYLKRIKANSLVHLAITSNLGALYARALKYLIAAARVDASVLFSLKFVRVLQIALFRLDVTRG